SSIGIHVVFSDVTICAGTLPFSTAPSAAFNGASSSSGLLMKAVRPSSTRKCSGTEAGSKPGGGGASFAVAEPLNSVAASNRIACRNILPLQIRLQIVAVKPPSGAQHDAQHVEQRDFLYD